ncbi:MAG: Protein translocase subunit SecF [Parcubacteria group bacterium GW2011_GWF1_40_6]|uniref:Protein-export membrane protein SecF n=2 Tax=Candidatus Nomuraibacteriota TaxID=1752729 RepID=A0A0G0QMZ0_9BACT|nr:MAG: Protein translocase subunit SecF [Candidatus Nomurabacteria bacterium GW2011_GWF2_40_12]KKR68413.1 MAG: Protein translocase subunit SecF [Parcubacteria group bacterium GW2011_GWF1_40_6]OGJ08819.1 MAG: protein-export membrane protein SecF [Candidatus Nomurabacteria bacterium RIFOXYB1_FULL_39_16]OGJ13985.1 MAG: protein-export membrane protein SecF [Candidatus Nomurabacteria bacterium RIFOXYD1_FULL_39_12]
MFIVKYKKIFLSISAVLVLLSIISMFYFGFNVGIDFKGGALTEVAYENDRPAKEDLAPVIEKLNIGSVLLQPTGDKGYIIKSRDLDENEHLLLLQALSGGEKNEAKETNFNSIGPSVGAELTRKAIISVILVSLAIICFIAFAFRKVSKPVSSWKYGLIAVVALLHDVIIPSGIFALLSHFYGAELDTLFVVAVLTILGLSVSDTIVIFDRIRENSKEQNDNRQTDFKTIVGSSLDQSFVRSIATSMTVILVLLALVFFGPESTKYFALMLTAGMFFGTYSSIFLASPLLVLVEETQKKK